MHFDHVDFYGNGIRHSSATAKTIYRKTFVRKSGRYEFLYFLCYGLLTGRSFCCPIYSRDMAWIRPIYFPRNKLDAE